MREYQSQRHERRLEEVKLRAATALSPPPSPRGGYNLHERPASPLKLELATEEGRTAIEARKQLLMTQLTRDSPQTRAESKKDAHADLLCKPSKGPLALSGSDGNEMETKTSSGEFDMLGQYCNAITANADVPGEGSEDTATIRSSRFVCADKREAFASESVSSALGAEERAGSDSARDSEVGGPAVQVVLVATPKTPRGSSSSRAYRDYTFHVMQRGNNVRPAGRQVFSAEAAVPVAAFTIRYSAAKVAHESLIAAGLAVVDLGFPPSYMLRNMVDDEANVKLRGQELEVYYTKLFSRYWVPEWLREEAARIGRAAEEAEAACELLAVNLNIQRLAAVSGSVDSVASVAAKATAFFSQVHASNVVPNKWHHPDLHVPVRLRRCRTSSTCIARRKVCGQGGCVAAT
eukprot:SAG31_NODE_4513_length_3176_cov_1.782255_3_plen_406_part_00